MTAFAIDRTGPVTMVGPYRPHPERVALVEARGALLYWDQLAPRAHPAAEIFDPDQAAAWLWDLYGPDAAGAILAGAETIATDWASPVLDAARRLAHANWAAAWWPSSRTAAVPALPQGLLRAEIAASTAAVEHLLDDEDAIARALEAVDLSALDALADDPRFNTEALALKAMLLDLAEDCGIVLSASPVPAEPDRWTLAAGTAPTTDLVVATGTAPVQWELVPQGLVDAAAEAAWTFTQRADRSILTVNVPAAPQAHETALEARIVETIVDLHLDPTTGMFTGEVAAPQGFLMLPTAARTVQVIAPGFAAENDIRDPEAPDRRAALIAFARERLTAADAGLAERAAGAS